MSSDTEVGVTATEFMDDRRFSSRTRSLGFMTHFIFYLCMFSLFSPHSCSPVSGYSGNLSDNIEDGPIPAAIFVGGLLIVCLISTIIGCLCCKNPILKTFRRPQNGLPSDSTRNSTFANQAPNSEFTIFPPESAMDTLHPVTADFSSIQFEPLPDICLKSQSVDSSHPLRPASFGNIINRGVNVKDWFDSPHCNFPRSQIQYLQEVGTGWFGHVIEGNAAGINLPEKQTKVVIKILKENAAHSDQMFFLQEVKPFRDLSHPNLLKLLGQCLECDPFLIILEHCIFKDLKMYLIQNRSRADIFFNGNNFLLNLAFDISSALCYMHQHGFIHLDLAARNCLLTENLQIKVGDYGTSIEKYKDDYYCLGDVALPLRWCPPETLHCTDTIIENKEITREANIWTFGILLWEILEFAKLPYIGMGDEEVLQKVIVDCSVILEQPTTPCIHKQQLYELMQMCWIRQPHQRPSMQKVSMLLKYLNENIHLAENEVCDFEDKWSSFKPDDFHEHNLPQDVVKSRKMNLKFESDFNPNYQDSSGATIKGTNPFHDSSPVAFESVDFVPSVVSPSLQNLRGSVEDVTAPNGVNCISDDESREYLKQPSKEVDNSKISRYSPEGACSIQDVSHNESDSSDSWKNDSSTEPNENSRKVMSFLKLTVIDSDNSDIESPYKNVQSDASGDVQHDILTKALVNNKLGGIGGCGEHVNKTNISSHDSSQAESVEFESSRFIVTDGASNKANSLSSPASPSSISDDAPRPSLTSTPHTANPKLDFSQLDESEMQQTHQQLYFTAPTSEQDSTFKTADESFFNQSPNSMEDLDHVNQLISESFVFLDKTDCDETIGNSFSAVPDDNIDETSTFESGFKDDFYNYDLNACADSVENERGQNEISDFEAYPEPEESSAKGEWFCGNESDDDSDSAIGKLRSFNGDTSPVDDFEVDLDSTKKGKLIPREIPVITSYPPPEEIVAVDDYLCGSGASKSPSTGDEGGLEKSKDTNIFEDENFGRMFQDFDKQFDQPEIQDEWPKKVLDVDDYFNSMESQLPGSDVIPRENCKNAKDTEFGLDSVSKGTLITREIPETVSYPPPEEIIAAQDYVCGVKPKSAETEKEPMEAMDIDLNAKKKGKLIPREIPETISYPPPEEIVAVEDYLCGIEPKMIPKKESEVDLEATRKGSLIPREIPETISYPAPEEIVAVEDYLCGIEPNIIPQKQFEFNLEGTRKGNLIPREIPETMSYPPPEEVVAVRDYLCGDNMTSAKGNPSQDKKIDLDAKVKGTPIPREIPHTISYPSPEEVVAFEDFLCGIEKKSSDKPKKDTSQGVGIDLDAKTKGKLIPRDIPKMVSHPSPEEVVAVDDYLCGLDEKKGGNVFEDQNFKALFQDFDKQFDETSNTLSAHAPEGATKPVESTRLKGSKQDNHGKGDLLEEFSLNDKLTKLTAPAFQTEASDNCDPPINDNRHVGTDDTSPEVDLLADFKFDELTEEDEYDKNNIIDDIKSGQVTKVVEYPKHHTLLDNNDVLLVDTVTNKALMVEKSLDNYSESDSSQSASSEDANDEFISSWMRAGAEADEVDTSATDRVGERVNETVIERELMYTPDFEDESDASVSSSTSASFKYTAPNELETPKLEELPISDPMNNHHLLINHQWSPVIMEDIPEEDEDNGEIEISSWDANATPTRSSLKSPDNKPNQVEASKSVTFSEQNNLPVYTYPRLSESSDQDLLDLSDLISKVDHFGYTDWDVDVQNDIPEEVDDFEFYDEDDNNYPIYKTESFVKTSPLHSSSSALYTISADVDICDGSECEVNTNIPIETTSDIAIGNTQDQNEKKMGDIESLI